MENSHIAIGLIDRQTDQLEAINQLEGAFYEGARLSRVDDATILNRWGGEALKNLRSVEKLAVFIRQNIFRPDSLEHLSIIAESRFIDSIENDTEASNLNDALSDLLGLKVSITIIPGSIQEAEILRDIITDALKK